MRLYNLQQASFAELCLIVLLASTGEAAGSLASAKRKCDHAPSKSDDLNVDKFCDATTTTTTATTAANKNNDLNRNDEGNCLRAAVVDYSRIDGTIDCRISVNKNLDVYDKIARVARDEGVQMLVFPEDGILYGSERYVRPCLEEIPDPATTPDYNPCLQPDRFGQSFPILTRLSCMAKESGSYVIANYGTKQKRDCGSGHEDCSNTKPVKGIFDQYYMLNTNVVFDPTGKYISRYRKWHPFFITEMFHKAPQLEHVYFDTKFGRFGVFTCFDMLFKEPTMTLVEKYHIDTALFPTFWFDETPILPAAQYQDAWSSRNQVNLLASNILKPSTGSIGSGIYSNNRSLYVTPDLDVPGQSRKTKILVSTIQARKQSSGSSCSRDPNTKMFEIDDNANPDPYNHKSYPLRASDNVREFNKLEDTQTVCSGKVCCSVDYKLKALPGKGPEHINRLVVLVRDAPRQLGWYEQVCVVATLKKPFVAPVFKEGGKDLELFSNEIIFDSDAVASFERLHLKAIFTTDYVFPSCAHNLTRLVERDQRQLSCSQTSKNDKFRNVCDLEYLPSGRGAESNKLYSFGMYGRVYERDREGI